MRGYKGMRGVSEGDRMRGGNYKNAEKMQRGVETAKRDFIKVTGEESCGFRSKMRSDDGLLQKY